MFSLPWFLHGALTAALLYHVLLAGSDAESRAVAARRAARRASRRAAVPTAAMPLDDVVAFEEPLRTGDFSEGKDELESPWKGPMVRAVGRDELFRVVLVADLDTASMSASEDHWRSELHYVTLLRDHSTGRYSVASVNNRAPERAPGAAEIDARVWRDDANAGPVDIVSRVADNGRSMELSDLILFGGRLLSMDDRTGILFELLPDGMAVPRQILMDGDGTSVKGFKGEWATIKDDRLFIGGLGKEWTEPRADGSHEIKHTDPCWVKVLDDSFGLKSFNWLAVYDRLREASGHAHPGYVLHEAVVFNHAAREWIFLPRRASRDSYDEVADEMRGTNIIFFASEDFKHLRMRTLGPLEPQRGFSSFKLVPGHGEELVAIKSEEVNGRIASHIVAFHLNGTVLMDSVPLGDVKLEGVEFLPHTS